MNSMQYGSTSPIENNIENITGSEPGNMEKDIVNNVPWPLGLHSG